MMAEVFLRLNTIHAVGRMTHQVEQIQGLSSVISAVVFSYKIDPSTWFRTSTSTFSIS